MEQSQVDENVINEPEEVEDHLDDDNSLSKEELLAKLARVNREAASRRISNKEKEQKLAEYEEWKRSQMSEADRLKVERDELKAMNDTLVREKVLGRVAKKANLDEDLVDLIKGDTEEEMLRSAKKLSEKFSKREPEKAPARGSELFPGKRGKPVGNDTGPDASAAFNSMLRRSND